MDKPDYQRSIVNLMTSIAAAAAPRAAWYPPLAELAERQLQERPLALFLIDGLGDALVSRYPDSWLCRHRRTRLTSVFPSTTATAVTAFATGVPAQQHAITGWFTYFRELGCVATTLPFVPRCGGAPFSQWGITPAELIAAPPLLERLQRPVTVLAPHYIVESDYSRALYDGVRREPHYELAGLFDQVVARVRRAGNPLVFAYWSELDRLAHCYGIGSPQVAAHFAELDQAFAMLAERLRGSGAQVLVTADHGLIDTCAERVLALEAHPELQEMLLLPLCGEPRAAFCYVRAGRTRDFEQYVAERLAHACELYVSEDLLQRGLFGRGEPSPRLRERIGDYVLLPRDNWIVKDRLPGERPFELIGVHGGLSAAELYVPLVLCDA